MRDMSRSIGPGDWHNVDFQHIAHLQDNISSSNIPPQDVVAVLSVRPLHVDFHIGRRTRKGIERLEPKAQVDGDGLFGIRLHTFGNNVLVIPAIAGIALALEVEIMTFYGDPAYRGLPVYS